MTQTKQRRSGKNGQRARPIPKGISAVCRSCGAHRRVPVREWYSSAGARCWNCGGLMDRVRPPWKTRAWSRAC